METFTRGRIHKDPRAEMVEAFLKKKKSIMRQNEKMEQVAIIGWRVRLVAPWRSYWDPGHCLR